MIPDLKKRLSELFTDQGAASLTREEHSELATHLRSDAKARRWWFVHQDVEVGLHAQARVKQHLAPRARGTLPGASWRPLIAAAVGIMTGILCTSVVFGFGDSVVVSGVSPREGQHMVRLEAKADGVPVLFLRLYFGLRVQVPDKVRFLVVFLGVKNQVKSKSKLPQYL